MYIILETQTNANGTLGTIVSQYEDRNQAESKYHQVLAAAALSTLPRHCAFMLSDEGYLYQSQCYTHTAPTEPDQGEIPSV